MKQILTLTFLLFALCAPAKIVKKNVPSHKMNRSIPCVIILPDNYDKKAAYPVIYLLHGYGGDQNSWITIKPALNDIATRDSLIRLSRWRKQLVLGQSHRSAITI